MYYVYKIVKNLQNAVQDTSWTILADQSLCFQEGHLSFTNVMSIGRSQLPCGLRRTSRSTAALLLRSWFRIPPGAWMFVCCVLSGRGLCNELIIRPEESYRLWHVVVCDQETS
jgi:hypothetical protein